MNILHAFWSDVKFARFSSGSGKLTISHIIVHCMSSPILSYINIFDININKIFCIRSLPNA